MVISRKADSTCQVCARPNYNVEKLIDDDCHNETAETADIQTAETAQDERGGEWTVIKIFDTYA